MRFTFYFLLLCCLPGYVFSSGFEPEKVHQLNASIEKLVLDKDYTTAIALCNAELQKSRRSSVSRFLIVSKARLFAKSRLFIDSIPILYETQRKLQLEEPDSLDLFLNGRSREIFGFYHYLERDVVQAINCLEQADSAYSFSTSFTNRIQNLNMLGTIYHLQEEYADALYNFLLALELLNEHTPQDSILLVDLKIDIGLVYFKLQLYDKALEYYADLMKLNFTGIQRAQVLNNLGIIFSEQGKLDVAKIHLLQALDVYMELNIEHRISHVYNNIGSVLEELNADQDSILYFYGKSLRIKKSQKDSMAIVSSYLNYAAFHFKRDRFDQAQQYLDSAWSLNNYFLIDDYTLWYLYKMRLERKRGNYEVALEYYAKHSAYQDSANTIKSAWQIKKAETEFKIQQQEQQIELLKKEQQINAIANSRKNIQIIAGAGVSIITIILLALVAVYFYNKQRLEQRIRNREVKLASVNNLVKGQEEERLRMAKELHDGVGNNLAIIKAEIGKDQANNTEEILDLISQTKEEVRSITHDLMPITVKKLGLLEAIQDLVDKWKHSCDLVIDVNANRTSFSLSKDGELTIYRIIQELIRNSVSHGQATYILINITQEKNAITMDYEDNGQGIKENDKPSTGIGFTNIRHRVAYLNGTFDLNSDENGVRMNFVFRINP